MDELRDDTASNERKAPAAGPDADRLRPYIPRAVLQHLADDPTAKCWADEGTAVFVDISGFTQLSEQLAAKGREGAEQIADVIGHCFEAILSIAYRNDGGLLKFGGDALLLWFHGERHAERACLSTVLMRRMLDEIGEIALRDARVTLRMAQGVHSGRFHFFVVGTSHGEFLPVGPAWTRLAAMEKIADGGEIVVSVDTGALLPPDCLGERKGLGFVLAHEPPGEIGTLKLTDPPPVALDALAHCLSSPMRAHVLAGAVVPELRPVTIAFIRFEGTDALIEHSGADTAADALHRLVTIVDAGIDEQDVCFLASDVDSDGGKLILTAGAPKVTGTDEERMLLALRKIVSSELPIPVRIGVHRGAVFAGDIGPAYRRTYTVMGDAVNLTARLMAKAEPGQIYATRDVLAPSHTLFETTDLPPFAVKGKAQPVIAYSVGKPHGSRTREVSDKKLPITGRNNELGVLRKALGAARSGKGCLLDVNGAAGIGKTRLLESLRDAATAAGFHNGHAVCEAYTSSIPYVVWQELLREMLGFGRDDADDAVQARVRDEIATRAPDLAPWMPLLAAVFGIEIASTPEVDMLAESNRRAKLHEIVASFLAAIAPQRLMLEIENVHHMDEASAQLLSYLVGQLDSRAWLFAIARRPASTGFTTPDVATIVRVDLKPLALQDAVRLAQLAAKDTPLPEHAIDVVAKRSGGNPQFLRDLLRTAIESGGTADLPDSAESAAMTQIDRLDPETRALVRRASLFGLTFHPRMLAWLYEDETESLPSEQTLAKLHDLVDEEPDGYLRFRSSLLRDSAYEGLPFKLRRQLHHSVAVHLEQEFDYPEEAAGILSLHYFEAGEHERAWHYANAAAKRATEVYAYVEAATFYARALQAAPNLPALPARDAATTHAAMGDAWYEAAQFSKALDAYAAARSLIRDDPLDNARLLYKLSHVEGKLGHCDKAIALAEESRDALGSVDTADAARQIARSGSFCAELLQREGRTAEALEWAERAIEEARTADDLGALAEAYLVKGWVYGDQGKPEALEFMQQSLDAYLGTTDFAMQARVRINLGTMCHWAGRWDEAMGHWEQGRDASIRVGDAIGAASARLNMGDILVSRGEWAEAEAMIRETLPVWRASQYRFLLGICLWYLGRVCLCQSRLDEAQKLLEEAKEHLIHVGAEQEVPAVEATIAECRIAAGNTDAALELVRGLLDRATESSGVAKTLSQLQRVHAHALLRQGDLWGARDALELSLVAAKERGDQFEATLTQLSLIELDRLEGIEPPIDIVSESRSVLGTFKVRAVPPVPLPPQQM